ncbi:hypothetical protein B005_5285 [Nocardiopsis alba ATCC BAA-2165]|uniref:Uncharacterized protein n=1 Tax=Nocardiopsis alba (strain ATCC BAA-2165 / BE74) TaxID=1205910 RepID=J7LBN5_NOCAA|nr:hypothetical protein B005_5285 [Nocardiopsis alba ATCC BAA-2165]
MLGHVPILASPGHHPSRSRGTGPGFVVSRRPGRDDAGSRAAGGAVVRRRVQGADVGSGGVHRFSVGHPCASTTW